MASPKSTTSDCDAHALAAEIATARARLAELQRLAREARARSAAAAKPEPRKIRLTKSTVRALPIPRDRMAIYWDRDLAGFGVRVSPAGRKTYFLQARTKTGRGVKITLGRADLVTAEQARTAAGRHLAAIELGRDPAAEIKAARQAERDRREAPTIDRLWELFAADYLDGKREKTRRAYGAWYRLHIRPALGRMKVADLTDQHVERLHRSVTTATGRSTANRCHAVLSSMLSYAVKRKLVAGNVARGAIAQHKEASRERTLTNDELACLIGHLAASPALEARLVEFLLATGCRLGEALAARWHDLDQSSGWWTKPAATTKSGKVHRAPLNGVAIEVMGKVERRGDLVFQATTESRLAKWWQCERRKLGLADVRLHDFRHCAASLAINSGAPLAVVGRMLGHGVHSAAITARYSHVADTALERTSAVVAERLRALREAEPAGSA